MIKFKNLSKHSELILEILPVALEVYSKVPSNAIGKIKVRFRDPKDDPSVDIECIVDRLMIVPSSIAMFTALERKRSVLGKIASNHLFLQCSYGVVWTCRGVSND